MLELFIARYGIGIPVLALQLYGVGDRQSFGGIYQRIVDEVLDKWGHQFVYRNDNGRIRKITSNAIAKELESLSPQARDSEQPIVSISYRSKREKFFGEVPPYFELLYSAHRHEIDIQLLLPIEAGDGGQTPVLTGLVRAWLDDFPLVCGTVSPAVSHSCSHSYTVTNSTCRSARAAFPGLQFIPRPPIGGHFDGLANWGELTLVGPDVLARMKQDNWLHGLPPWVDVDLVGDKLLIRAQGSPGSLADASGCNEAKERHRKIADLLAPYQCSAYDFEYGLPQDEWHRLAIDWNSTVN